MTFSVFSRVGPYEIVEVVGTGGMGLVYRARDMKLQRDVAIKLLPSAVAADPERAARFTREAHAASALNHPHIVTVFDILETWAGRCLVMEFVEGRTLRECVWPRPDGVWQRPDVRWLAGVALQIARAISAAHERGIVHRDIKPENVMVRSDGYVKVLDFGLARFVGVVRNASTDTTYVTGPGVVLGTVRYMSPEQSRGEPTTRESDVFSLGVVLYELASGRHPFKSEWASEVVDAIQNRVVLPLRPLIPKALDLLILRMLEKEPHLRPSADDVVHELEVMTRPPIGESSE